MAILELHTDDAPILRQNASPVVHIDDALLKLIDDMFETMHDAAGIGLAAPQVGVAQRVIIVDIAAHFPECPPMTLLNPAITNATGEALGEEGCLSLPGQRGIVRRAEEITVQSQLPDGRAVVFNASGLMARVIQHEIDHLDGILFIDRLIPEDQVLLEDESLTDESPDESSVSR